MEEEQFTAEEPRKEGSDMKKIILVLLSISALLLVFAFAQDSQEPADIETTEDSVALSLYPRVGWDAEVVEAGAFTYPAMDWSAEPVMQRIQTPFVNNLHWVRMDIPELRHFVVIGDLDRRSCIGYYGAEWEEEITPETLARAVATCYDVIMAGRDFPDADAQNPGTAVNTTFVDAYTDEFLGTCGETFAPFSWVSPAGESCDLPDIFEIWVAMQDS